MIVVSQGLSPNARLAFRHAGSYERVLVLTSSRPANSGPEQMLADVQARGGTVVVLPPPEENVTLLRVLGPAAAALAACLIVERARGAPDLEAIVKELPGVLASAKDRALSAAGHSSETTPEPHMRRVRPPQVPIRPERTRASRTGAIEPDRNTQRCSTPFPPPFLVDDRRTGV